MKFISSLFVLLALCAVGTRALTPEQKENLHNTNLHHIGNLDENSRQCLDKLMNAVEQRETFVRLDNAIKGGHSVMFEVVAGSPNPLKELAGNYKLKVKPSKSCKCKDCCGRIILPGASVVSAVAVPGKRAQRAGLAASLNPKDSLPSNKGSSLASSQAHAENQERLKQGLDDNKIEWYYQNNLAQISKMDANAQLFVKKLIEDLRSKSRTKTVIQLLSPVPNGHAVRFDLVRGNVSTIQRLARRCGVKVTRNTIVAPEKGLKLANGEAAAETDGGHLVVEHAEQDDAGVPEKIEPVDASKRNVVSQLPDKWLPSFLAEEEQVNGEDADLEEQTDAFIEDAIDSLADLDEDDAFLLDSL